MPNTQPLYAGVYKPNLLRKGVLFAIQDSLALLKNASEIRKKNDAKIKALAELRDTMGEVNILSKRLMSLLPDLAQAPLERKKTDLIIPQLLPEKVDQEPKKRADPVRSKISLLESELALLESHVKRQRARRRTEQSE